MLLGVWQGCVCGRGGEGGPAASCTQESRGMGSTGVCRQSVCSAVLLCVASQLFPTIIPAVCDVRLCLWDTLHKVCFMWVATT